MCKASAIGLAHNVARNSVLVKHLKSTVARFRGIHDEDATVRALCGDINDDSVKNLVTKIEGGEFDNLDMTKPGISEAAVQALMKQDEELMSQPEDANLDPNKPRTYVSDQ